MKGHSDVGRMCFMWVAFAWWWGVLLNHLNNRPPGYLLEKLSFLQ